MDPQLTVTKIDSKHYQLSRLGNGIVKGSYGYTDMGEFFQDPDENLILNMSPIRFMMIFLDSDGTYRNEILFYGVREDYPIIYANELGGYRQQKVSIHCDTDNSDLVITPNSTFSKLIGGSSFFNSKGDYQLTVDYLGNGKIYYFEIYGDYAMQLINSNVINFSISRGGYSIITLFITSDGIYAPYCIEISVSDV